MPKTPVNDFLIEPHDLVLVTGASGFIGTRLVECLLERGLLNVRCLVRPTGDLSDLTSLAKRQTGGARLELVEGNLLSREDCNAAMKDVAVVFHLATARDGKSYPDAYMNSVVTTRNLLEAALKHTCLRRFVNVSSLAVYTNLEKAGGRLLDETCTVETRPELRGDAYCFAKVKQDEIVTEYGQKFGLPYVIVRPGYVLGPAKSGIASRVGIDTFGLFMHLGGSNSLPFTYIDNCADAIVLAGLTKGVDGEVFNVVDDNLPSSRQFLRMYKKNVRNFVSLYIPHAASYALCFLWERYSSWSEQQLPPNFNRRHWHAYWKKTRYTNAKLKKRLGWVPRVPMNEALSRCFSGYQDRQIHA
jgi:nucleoside-diphosphate-sugar epimerase